MSLLEVKNLHISFLNTDSSIPAVQDVSFSVNPGEILCIVGESGCGKSITSLSIMGLLPSFAQVTGEILFDGKNLLALDQDEMRKVRGNQISMIFQEPMTSLNPVFTIGYQLIEPFLTHQSISKKEAYREAVRLLELVGIPDPEKRMKQYPHELSGGMRQRVMIAMALACHPKLLIADEPTTALDVTVQAQILDLILKLRDETGMGVIFITHDMGVVAEIADRILVMYAGKVVEEGDTQSVFHEPKHPYTQGLLRSVPNVDEEQVDLYSIPGSLPKPGSITQGCPFHPRCEMVSERCLQTFPSEVVHNGHRVYCWLEVKEGVKDVEGA